ncbi:MAG: hypothetical protein IJ242_13110, partial [Clostridia bacterium]|nr:hypothetical protein [Clostridia bacterium]
GAVSAAGIDRVVFGTPDPSAGCCGSVYAIPEDPAFGRMVICDGPLLADRCRAVLDTFFTGRRNEKAGNISREETVLAESRKEEQHG